MEESRFEALKLALSDTHGLDFAVLIGSRANGQARPDSDWDIAIQWHDYSLDPLGYFSRNEELRQICAHAVNTDVVGIDVIDLHRAGLTIRAAVAEEGIPLKGEDDLPWMRFLTRTWRDLEHWYLEQEHAA